MAEVCSISFIVLLMVSMTSTVSLIASESCWASAEALEIVSRVSLACFSVSNAVREHFSDSSSRLSQCVLMTLACVIMF